MRQFAPAPWKIEPHVDAIHIADANGKPVAYLADRALDDIGMPPDNAKLIAAAPELLRLLKSVANVSGSGQYGDELLALDLIRRLEA